MRTKTLLLTAALSAAGVATSMAQVYSVNAVGYVNVTIPAGSFKLINNPLTQGGNTANEIIPNGGNPGGLPDGATLSTWDPTKPNIGGLDDNLNVLAETAPGIFEWFSSGPTPSYAPGRGMLVLNPGGSAANLTFVGEVMQGNPISPAVPINAAVGGVAKNTWPGSQVPQAGRITTDLGFQFAEDDFVSLHDLSIPNGPYLGRISGDIFVYAGGWFPSEPMIGVAEAFYLTRNASSPTSWTRSFSVNP